MWQTCKTSLVDEDAEFVVEELARRTGLTVRSIRSYQTRKLLPPPSLRNRTGFYGEQHVARIELIKDLQSQGLKLSSIARLLDDEAGSDAELLRFSRSLASLFDERSGAMVTAEELQRRFDVDDDEAAAVLSKAIALGLLRDLGDGLFEELSPRLLNAGHRAMSTLHLDARAALRVVERLQRHSQDVASMYVDLFTERVWIPFAEAGRPHARWPEVEAALSEVRTLATEALVSSFELVMSAEIGKAFDRDLSGRRPRTSRGRRHVRSRPSS